MSSLLASDDDKRIGDRVVVSHLESPYRGQVGVIAQEHSAYSLYYGTRVVVVLLESGLPLPIVAESLLKSPYQNEPLEAVPRV